MATLPERLKTIRKRAGLTQKEFGRLFGLADNTVSQYENGLHAPSDEIKIAIANHYHVSMDYLMGETDDPETDSKTPSVFSAQISPEGVAAVHAYAALAPEHKKMVEDLINVLVDLESLSAEKERRNRKGGDEDE